MIGQKAFRYSRQCSTWQTSTYAPHQHTTGSYLRQNLWCALRAEQWLFISNILAQIVNVEDWVVNGCSQSCITFGESLPRVQFTMKLLYCYKNVSSALKFIWLEYLQLFRYISMRVRSVEESKTAYMYTRWAISMLPFKMKWNGFHWKSEMLSESDK